MSEISRNAILVMSEPSGEMSSLRINESQLKVIFNVLGLGKDNDDQFFAADDIELVIDRKEFPSERWDLAEIKRMETEPAIPDEVVRPHAYGL